MSTIPDSIDRLIEEFSRFPGIGRKTAQRMVFHVLKSPDDHAVELAQAVMDMKTKIRFCSICNGITEEDPCKICTNPKRDQSSICIVEDAADIYTFEKTNAFQGLYHVLGGVGPEDLNLDALVDRAQSGYEIIIATNPTIEGEATSLYIAKLLKGKEVKVTRLARGLPMGGDLEYIDDATILRAMEGRTVL